MMFNKLCRSMKKEKGFTLVELMVVVVIIGILVAIAVPVYNSVTDKAAISAHNANVRTLMGAANTAISSYGPPAADCTWLTAGGTAEGNYVWSKWLQAPFPEFPNSLPIAAKDSVTAYTVTLKADGTVTVVPDIYTP